MPRRKAEPTEAQRLNRIGKRICAALEDALKPYAGRNVQLFFESESAAIFIMDADHPHFIDDGFNAAERQEAILGRIPIGVSRPFDAGAW